MTIIMHGWQVAFRQKSLGTILSDQKSPFFLIKNTWRYMAADPFIVKFNNETYIFAELYDNVLRRGIIGWCRWKKNKFSKWRPALIESFHLSFPNIIQKNGVFFMIPESCVDNRIWAYRAISFPNKWEKSHVLLDGQPCSDTAILEKDNLLIGLSCHWDPRLKETKYYELIQLFMDPMTYTVNKTVSVRTGEYACRPAGNPFVYDNKIYFPYQDCSGNEYGKALVFTVMDKIKQDDCFILKDHEVCRISSTDICLNNRHKIYGVHTYNANSEFEVYAGPGKLDS